MNQEEEIIKKAADIHRQALVIDAHCDTLERACREGAELDKFPAAQLDLLRLRAVGGKVQFFAAYIGAEFKPERSLKRALQLIDFFHRQMEKNGNSLRLVRSTADIAAARRSGQIAALLSVEGGEPVEGDLAYLRILYQLGVRCLGLTWNQRNQLADGAGERDTRGGLTRYGHEVVREMNRLGMLVDVSHLAEAGFWDVLETSTQPIIASHSNCYTLSSHWRNLTDRQILALAKAGGVMGITFVADFLAEQNASIANVFDHIDYIADLAGIDCIGLGSDFDGIDHPLAGLEDVTRLPRLTEGLLRRGYSEADIQKILGGNTLRVLNEVIDK